MVLVPIVNQIVTSMVAVILVGVKTLLLLLYISIKIVFCIGLFSYIMYNLTLFCKGAAKWSLNLSLGIHYRQLNGVLIGLILLISQGQHCVTECMPHSYDNLPLHPGTVKFFYDFTPIVETIDTYLGLHEDAAGQPHLLVTNFQEFEEYCSFLNRVPEEGLTVSQEPAFNAQQAWVSGLDLYERIAHRTDLSQNNTNNIDLNGNTVEEIRGHRFTHGQSRRAIRLAVEHASNSGRDSLAVRGHGGRIYYFEVVPRFTI